jgi:hypothetical protein
VTLRASGCGSSSARVKAMANPESSRPTSGAYVGRGCELQPFHLRLIASLGYLFLETVVIVSDSVGWEGCESALSVVCLL